MLKTQRMQCDMEAIDDLFPYDNVVITHWSELPSGDGVTGEPWLEYAVQVWNMWDEVFHIHSYTEPGSKVRLSIQSCQADVLSRMHKPVSLETTGLSQAERSEE